MMFSASHSMTVLIVGYTKDPVRCCDGMIDNDSRGWSRGASL